jgi:hypothetical protein
VIVGTAHGGTHSARFGPNNLGYISQTLATTAGAMYTLDFWLNHGSGAPGTEWLVSVDGNTLMDVHDAPAFGYTEFTFTFTATSSSTTLQFGFAEPPNWFYLDDVSVVQQTTNPHVTSTSPAGGQVVAPFQTVRVTFDRAMNASTFTGQVTLTGPSGSIPVTVSPVGTSNTQFDVNFTAQTAVATYTLMIGTGVQDQTGHALASPYSAQFIIPLLANGNFATGDFTGWTRSGDPSYTSVITGTPDGTTIHSGTHALQTGPGTSLGYIAQTVATTVGASYTLDFWLSHPFPMASGTEWLVSVGGNILMDVMNPGQFNYTEFTFTFTATSTATVVQFGFLEPPTYFYLDDITVTAN